MLARAFRLGLIILLLTAVSAAADASEEPRMALVKWGGDGLRSLNLIDTNQAGEDARTLVHGDLRLLPVPYPYDNPSWSPDGSMLAYTAVTAVRRTRFSSGPRTKIFVISSDGSDARPVPGTSEGTSPVFAPDGQTIAFSRRRSRQRANGQGGGDVVYESEAIFLGNLEGSSNRRLTPWRNGLRWAPASFSPDGSRLAASRQIGDRDPEAMELLLEGGGTQLVARHASTPVYSPDGSRIALLHHRRHTVRRRGSKTRVTRTDLFTMRTDGSERRRLTNTAEAIELAPSWDPSGERLAFTRIRHPSTEAGLLGFGDVIAEINADGTCAVNVLSAPRVVYFGAAWQPGPGREAGRIAC